MTKDWTAIYQNLPDGEKDKIAILRVMECSNGVIQHAFRDKIDWALSIDDTRRAMQFSMSCSKLIEVRDPLLTCSARKCFLALTVFNLNESLC